MTPTALIPILDWECNMFIGQPRAGHVIHFPKREIQNEVPVAAILDLAALLKLRRCLNLDVLLDSKGGRS